MFERIDELITLGAAVCELPLPTDGLSRLGFVPISHRATGVPLTVVEVAGCYYVRTGFFPVRQLSYFSWLFGLPVRFFHGSATLSWGKLSSVDVETGFIDSDSVSA